MIKYLYCQYESGVTKHLALPLAALGSSAYNVCEKSPLPLMAEKSSRPLTPVISFSYPPTFLNGLPSPSNGTSTAFYYSAMAPTVPFGGPSMLATTVTRLSLYLQIPTMLISTSTPAFKWKMIGGGRNGSSWTWTPNR